MGTATAPAWVFDPARLRAARLAAGLSAYKAGKAIGRHKDTIYTWELGQISPQADDLAALASLYGVDVAEFFPEAA